MSTLIDINIPYASGSAGSIDGNNVADSNGFGWCWIGGNNNRKIFSLRMQTDENYWFVEVSEVDDLQVTPMTKSVLYTKAIPSDSEGLFTTRNDTLEMCRLSSSAVYLKVHPHGVFNNAAAASYHYVIEIDEDNGNEVSVTDVNEQIPDWLRGGAYNYSNYPYSTGQGIHHRFMHQLGENKIVTYEANTHGNYGFGSLVERSWDPVTKSLTNRVVVQNHYGPSVRTNANYRLSSSGYGDLWSFVPELDTNGYDFIAPYDGNTTYLVEGHGAPTFIGSENQIYQGDNNPTMNWITVTTGRDGLVHLSMGTEYIGGTSTHSWYHLNVNMNWTKYVLTYNPVDGSWGITGRYLSGDDLSLPFGRDDYGIWLPLNVKSAEDYMTETEMDSSQFNGVQNSRVCKTWIYIGADSQQVVGVGTGSPQDHRSALNVSNARPEQAYQAVWLDYDHFIVFGWKTVPSTGMDTSYKYNSVYAIYRYYDENKIDLVSSGNIDSSTQGSIMQMNASNVFQRPTANTFLSDKFANSLHTLSAGQS